MSFVDTGMSQYPYPGLRPFNKSESDIFFGRDEQIDQLLNKLDDHRFLAVLGPSGCGKSSLVRAGVIPALETGFVASAGYRWRTATFRPGDCPLDDLARALVEEDICSADPDNQDEELAFLGATLKSGPLGLVEALKQHNFSEEENLLLLVDQFEELFRFERTGGRSESRAFVELLLASADHEASRIYVVITMRSEFLGQCPVFRGLPEAMNDSQFLTPRLSREQIHDAIVGPGSMFNTHIEPEVVTRILNEMGTDPDQLPLMQHLLMRMWRRAALDILPDEDDGDNDYSEPDENRDTHDTLRGLDSLDVPEIVLTMHDYEAAGGLSQALSKHANKTYTQSLQDDRERRTAERLFRCLTEKNPEGHIIRRPTLLADVCKACDIDIRDRERLQPLKNVIDSFRANGRSFLMPPAGEPLLPETRLDISHEALIRKWERLKEWTEDEDRLRVLGEEIQRKADRWQKADRHEDWLLTGADLVRAVTFRERYEELNLLHRLPDGLLEFLKASEDRRDRQQRQKRRAAYVPLLGGFLIIAMLLTVWAFREQKGAEAKVAKHVLDKAMWTLLGGDVSGALLRTQHALELDEKLGNDERARIHRIRLGAGVSQMARLQNLWGLENRNLARMVLSPDRQFAVTVGQIEDLEQDEEETTKIGRATIWRVSEATAVGSPTRAGVQSVSPPNTPVFDLEHEHPVKYAAWGPDNHFLLTATSGAKSSGQVVLWDLRGDEAKPHELDIPAGHGATLVAWISTRDGHYLVAVTGESRISQTVTTWLLAGDFDQSDEYVPPQRQDEFKLEGTVATIDVFGASSIGNDEQNKAAQSEPEPRMVLAGTTTDSQGFVHIRRVVKKGEAESLVANWKIPVVATQAIFDRDGQSVAVACADGQIRICDSRDPKPWEMGRPLVGHENTVIRIEFSPDWTLLASASRDNTGRVWNVESGEEIACFTHNRWVYTTRFSPDQRYVVTGSRDQTLKVWELASQSLAFPPLNQAGAAEQIAFTSDAAYLLARSWATIRRWNLDNSCPPPMVCRVPSKPSATSNARQDRYLALVSSDSDSDLHQALVWDHYKNTKIAIDLPAAATALAVSDDGKYLFVSGLQADGKRPCWAATYDITTGKRIAALQQHDFRQAAGAPADDAEADEPQRDADQWFKDACFFCPESDAKKPLLVTVSESIGGSSETSFGTKLSAVKSTQCTVRTWDPISGELISTDVSNTTGEARCLRFSPDGTKLMLGTAFNDAPTNAGNVVLWSVDSDGQLELQHSVECDGMIDDGVFCPKAEYLVTTANANRDRIWYWDIRDSDSGEAPKPLLEMRHTSDVTCVDLIEIDGRRFIISGSVDNTARIWDLAAERKTPEQGPPEIQSMWVLEHDREVNDLAFDPRHKLLATCSQDETARIWDPTTGELVAVFRDAGAMESVEFRDSERSLRLLTRCRDFRGKGYHVNQWNLEQLKEEEFACLQLLAARKRTEKDRLEPREDFDNWKQIDSEGERVAEQLLKDHEIYAAKFLQRLENPKERHLRQAAEAELRGEWFTVDWHLSRVKGGGDAMADILRQQARTRFELEKWNEVIDDVAELHQLGKCTWRDRLLAGDAQMKKGQWTLALEQYRAGSELAPGRGTASSNAISWQLLESRIQANRALGDWDRIIDLCNEALGTPGFERQRLLRYRLEAAATQENWDLALTDLQEIADAAPTDLLIYRQLAIVQLRSGDIDGYKATCLNLIAMAEEKAAKQRLEPDDANTVAWVCSLTPEAMPPQIRKAAVDYARDATRENPGIPKYVNTYAAAKFRNDEAQEAYTSLTDSSHARRENPDLTALDPTRQKAADGPGIFGLLTEGNIWDWLYLTLVQAKLAETETSEKEAADWVANARRSYNSAKLWSDQRQFLGGMENSARGDALAIPWHQRLELLILLDQANKAVENLAVEEL